MWLSPALLIDSQREAADEVGVGDDYPLGARLGDLEIRLDRAGDVTVLLLDGPAFSGRRQP